MSDMTEAQVAQAFKHPLRRRLLSTFLKHGLLSPKEAADLLKAPLDDVSYHVRVLVQYKFLTLRAKAEIRGASKNYYLPSDEVLNSTMVKEFFAQNPSTGLD